MTTVYSNSVNLPFYNTSSQFSLRCGNWACGCMDGDCGFTSCAETIKYYQDSEIAYQANEERKRLRKEAYQRELLERPPVIVPLPTILEEKPHHQHRRPAQSANGPCTCANLTCTKRHIEFAGHKCCTWVESKSHSCNSTTTHEVVINGITCINCEVGIHRPGLNTWKP